MSTSIRSKIKLDTPVTIRTFALGITSLNLLDLNDVDATDLSDGAMMIYHSDTRKFVLSAKVNHPKVKIIGGKY